MGPRRAATILHADLDAFYASVEQLIDPRLQGKAVAVGAGVVLAASYEAKAWGIRAGMPGWRARELCPALLFCSGHFREYQRLADAVMVVLHGFTPLVERISIDEAFLDVAGSVHLFGPPGRIGSEIRRQVRHELGLAISVGAATTKHLAKVASQVAKPDGLVVVQPGRERAFLDPLPVELLWGVGPVTRARLAQKGIRTVGDLAAVTPTVLQRLVRGAAGTHLGRLAANEDPRPVSAGRRARSVGAQLALGRRKPTEHLLHHTLGSLADQVATRLRAGGRAGRTVTVRVRFPGARSVTRSVTLPDAISTTRTLAEIAVRLAHTALADHPHEREVTLVAISVSALVPEAAVQLELPFGSDDRRYRPAGATSSASRRAVDSAVDDIRARFGRDAVGYAGAFLGRASDAAGRQAWVPSAEEASHGVANWK